MAFLDKLKRQAQQAARSAGNQAFQNLGQAAKETISNKCWSFSTRCGTC